MKNGLSIGITKIEFWVRKSTVTHFMLTNFRPFFNPKFTIDIPMDIQSIWFFAWIPYSVSPTRWKVQIISMSARWGPKLEFRKPIIHWSSVNKFLNVIVAKKNWQRTWTWTLRVVLRGVKWVWLAWIQHSLRWARPKTIIARGTTQQFLFLMYQKNLLLRPKLLILLWESNFLWKVHDYT